MGTEACVCPPPPSGLGLLPIFFSSAMGLDLHPPCHHCRTGPGWARRSPTSILEGGLAPPHHCGVGPSNPLPTAASGLGQPGPSMPPPPPAAVSGSGQAAVVGLGRAKPGMPRLHVAYCHFGAGPAPPPSPPPLQTWVRLGWVGPGVTPMLPAPPPPSLPPFSSQAHSPLPPHICLAHVCLPPLPMNDRGGVDRAPPPSTPLLPSHPGSRGRGQHC